MKFHLPNFCNEELISYPIVTHGILLITQTPFFVCLFGVFDMSRNDRKSTCLNNWTSLMLVGINEIALEIYMLNFCIKETTFNPIVTQGIVLITQTPFFPHSSESLLFTMIVCFVIVYYRLLLCFVTLVLVWDLFC